MGKTIEEFIMEKENKKPEKIIYRKEDFSYLYETVRIEVSSEEMKKHLADEVDEAFIERINELYEQYVSKNIYNTTYWHYDGGQNRYELNPMISTLKKMMKESKKDKFTFLEVGGSMGLWSIILDVISKDIGKEIEYVTVTLIEHNPDANKNLYRVQKYYHSNNKFFHIIDGDSTDPETIQLAKETYPEGYDFVFIDADHSYEFAYKDIENYTPMCNHVLLFHDIKPEEMSRQCGVKKAINEHGIILDVAITDDAIGVMGLGFKIIESL